jgi:hypothetical protein
MIPRIIEEAGNPRTGLPLRTDIVEVVVVVIVIVPVKG